MTTPPKPRISATHTGTRFCSFAFSLLLPLGLLACPGSDVRSDNARADANASSATNENGGGNINAGTIAPASRAVFDGQRAFAHVGKMVGFGARPAGSPELAQTRDYMIAELQSAGLKVTTDEFTQQTPVGARKMVNITAELPGESADVIMFSSHYDTKPFKEFRFVGANDGGSSTGAVLELARSLAATKHKPRYTYWFVFFDGEEAFCKGWDDCKTPQGADNTYGSRRYVAQLKARSELKRVRALILLDMIGYKDLAIPRESMSTSWLAAAIWETGQALGYGAQFPDTEESVEDDHLAFLQAGVESVDLIQLSGYPYWHRPEDTLDKISPRSLQVVGDTLIASLPRIEQHLGKQ